MYHFAVIGTRDMTEAQREWVDSKLSYELGRCQVSGEKTTLHTGAALGTDQWAAERWCGLGKQVQLHLPWSAYESYWVSDIRHRYAQQVEIEIEPCLADSDRYNVAVHHPRWDTLSQGAQKLHLRNHAIIASCVQVYACPGIARWGGGTAMGIKLACHYRIACDVFDPVLQRDWSHCGCE